MNTMNRIPTHAMLAVTVGLLAGCAGQSRIGIADQRSADPEDVRAEVFKAAELPAPTVLVLHGCGGVDQHHRDWARQLQQWGFNAVIVDSFKPRYVSTVCDNSGRVAPITRAIDAQLTAKWAIEQDWSTDKVGMVGYSHGGWTVLRASTREDAQREFGGRSYITSGVAYYPYCGFTYQFFTPGIPLQIHMGTDDDWTPASYCQQLARDWKIADQYFEYAQSHHGFDRQATHITVQGRGVDNTIGPRTLRSNPEANRLARQRTLEFFNQTLR